MMVDNSGRAPGTLDAGTGSDGRDGMPGAAFGSLLRDAQRAFTRALQARIAPHGVSMGQWFFLRALWSQDGLTQRELSQRVGMMEPTTVTALNGMERRGLVVRVRNAEDRRKINVFLTDRGRELEGVLLPCADDLMKVALAGIPGGQLDVAGRTLLRIIENLDDEGAGVEVD